jgi:hypothetical protein
MILRLRRLKFLQICQNFDLAEAKMKFRNSMFCCNGYVVFWSIEQSLIIIKYIKSSGSSRYNKGITWYGWNGYGKM